MKKQYLNMYKWDNLPDGNIEKFNGRLDALPFEISLNNKFGCADILIPIYLPYDMYNSNMEKQYLKAKKDYELRSEKLTSLIELIKNNVDCNKMIDNEYLYEL